MFYAPGFDPFLILAQIACMQSALYLSLGIWLVILTALSGSPISSISLRHMFSDSAMRLSFTNGWVPMVASLINAASGCVTLLRAVVCAVGSLALTSCAHTWRRALALCVIVERAKKCLDFTTTFFCLHMLGCWYHSGFPTSWEWWLTTGLGIIMMALLGEFLCMKREMQEIPLFSLSAGHGPGYSRVAGLRRASDADSIGSQR